MWAERRAGSHVLCPGRCTLPWHAALASRRRAGTGGARDAQSREWAGTVLREAAPAKSKRLLSWFWDEKNKERTAEDGWNPPRQDPHQGHCWWSSFLSEAFPRELLEVLGAGWTFLPCSGCVRGSLAIFPLELWVLLTAWRCCHGPEALPWHSILWHGGQAGVPPLRLLPEEKTFPLQIRVSSVSATPGLCWEGATLRFGVTISFLGVWRWRSLVGCAGKGTSHSGVNLGLSSLLADCLGESLVSLFMKSGEFLFYLTGKQRWWIKSELLRCWNTTSVQVRIQAEGPNNCAQLKIIPGWGRLGLSHRFGWDVCT